MKENGQEHRSEVLADLIQKFHFWFGPDLPQYIGREAEMPFDNH